MLEFALPWLAARDALVAAAVAKAWHAVSSSPLLWKQLICTELGLTTSLAHASLDSYTGCVALAHFVGNGACIQRWERREGSRRCVSAMLFGWLVWCTDSGGEEPNAWRALLPLLWRRPREFGAYYWDTLRYVWGRGHDGEACSRASVHNKWSRNERRVYAASAAMWGEPMPTAAALRHNYSL